MDEDWIIQIGSKSNLLPQLCKIKKGLIDGLNSIELINGWPDTHISESDAFVWTSATILNILISQNIIPNNFQNIIDFIDSNKKTESNYTGWIMGERFIPLISTYVTSDVLSLFITLNKIDNVSDIIKTLQELQNDDGGWGVCSGDKESKIRSTVSVLNALLDCYNHSGTKNIVNIDSIKKGIIWLYKSQIDQEVDCGWSIFCECQPSSVSSTAGALSLLLRAGEIDKSLGYKEEALKRGLKTLINMGEKGFWLGDVEDVAIKVNDKFVGRHSSGGLGTLTVISTLISAINLDLLPIGNIELYKGINNIIVRSKAYNSYKGLWITPSDQNGPPIIWNSAFALKSINQIEKFYIKLLENNYIEKRLYIKMSNKVRIWKNLTFSLISAIVGSYIISKLNAKGITSFFSSISPLSQGLILIAIALITQETYRVLAKPIFIKLKNLTSRLQPDAQKDARR